MIWFTRLFLDRMALHFNLGSYHLFQQYTELTLRDGLNPMYKLELFVGNEEIELQKRDSRTWAPARRPYVLCSSATCNS